ncbi:MAG: polymer-forming cytoskeletal protein [Erysipelotrichaceae bacterium]
MDNLKKKQNEKMQKSVKSKFMEFAEMTGFAKKQESEEITLKDVQDLIPNLVKEDEIEKDNALKSKFELEKEVTPEPIVVEEPKLDTTIIAKSISLEGNINSEGNVETYGAIKGDICAKGKIDLYGIQNGNINGQAIAIEGAKIDGNITAKANIKIDSESTIRGDVVADSIDLDGSITGIIHAEGLVCLHRNAILNGDIQAGSISIDEGAQIYGQITMKNSHIIKTPDNYMNLNY